MDFVKIVFSTLSSRQPRGEPRSTGRRLFEVQIFELRSLLIWASKSEVTNFEPLQIRSFNSEMPKQTLGSKREKLPAWESSIWCLTPSGVHVEKPNLNLNDLTPNFREVAKSIEEQKSPMKYSPHWGVRNIEESNLEFPNPKELPQNSKSLPQTSVRIWRELINEDSIRRLFCVISEDASIGWTLALEIEANRLAGLCFGCVKKNLSKLTFFFVHFNTWSLTLELVRRITCQSNDNRA